MKKILFIIFLLASLSAFAQMTPQWKYKFGMPLFAGAAPEAMELDDSNNVYIFDEVVNYNWNRTTNIDPMLRKLNSSGQLLWYKNFGAVPEVEEHPYGLKKDGHGCLYALYNQAYNEMVLTKLDYNGNVLWNNIIGRNDNYIYGNITKLKVSGSGVCYTNIRRYDRNILIKINAAGVLIDSIIVNEGNTYGSIENFEVSPSNRILAIGTSDLSYPGRSSAFYIDSVHNLIWGKTLDAYAQKPQILFLNNSEFYISYYDYRDTNRIHVLKYDNSGNILWNYAASRGSYISWWGWALYPSLRFDDDGNILFSGNILKAKNSFYFVKINSQSGNVIWEFKSADIFNYESFLGNTAKDSSGNYYLCGRVGFIDLQSGSNSFAIFKLSNAGTLLRTTLNNGYHYASFLPQNIGITNTNDVIVSGMAADTGSYDFYGQSLTIKYSQPVNITSNGNSLPDKFSLKQNYPNPFNPETVISFQLSVAGFVSMKVFDINGREVSELINKNLQAGKYKINFNGSALPSGVYYYKLISENFSEAKKMILVK